MSEALPDKMSATLTPYLRFRERVQEYHSSIVFILGLGRHLGGTN